MTLNRNVASSLVAAAAAALLAAPANLAAQAGAPAPPAGQVCPQGAYVIGFDAQSNIICSGFCGNGVVDRGEACDDGNAAAGDGCSPQCQQEAAPAPTAAVAAPAVVAGGEDTGTAAAPAATAAAASQPQVAPAAEAATMAPVAELAIDDIDPWSVVFGKREVTVTITGSGFDAATVVRFNGSDHAPRVDTSGTQLEVTLPTQGLSIGPYPVTVVTGSGQQATVKRGLVVF
jgi:cysteine-rich repeat protein